MGQITNIAFDLGGVVLALSYDQAVRRFEEIGLKDARQQLDAFEQKGIFGDLESLSFQLYEVEVFFFIVWKNYGKLNILFTIL